MSALTIQFQVTPEELRNHFDLCCTALAHGSVSVCVSSHSLLLFSLLELKLNIGILLCYK